MGTSRYIRIVVAILWACLCLDSHAQVKPAISPAGLTVTNLRVENLAGVLGLDEKSPRLSWLVESAERGQKPTAYRIVVSRTVDALKQDKGDQWDTGKVASDQISQIIYGGKPLQSHHQYFWKVQAWDS
jgi:alpha-L-rhamnosidase